MQLFALLLCLIQIPAHASDLYQAFTYQGRFYSPDGSSAMTDVVDLVVGIYSPMGDCLLYEQRTQNIDLAETGGFFAIQIGSEIGDPIRVSGRDPGKKLSEIFSNSGQIFPAGPHCEGGYTSGSGDFRRLRVTVEPQNGPPETMNPDLTITPVPQATVAETLQGLDPTKFVQISGASASYTVSKSALDVLLGIQNQQDASALHHHDSLYAQLGMDGSLQVGAGKYLELGVQNTNPDTTGWSSDPTKIGRTWFDSSTSEIKFWDGASIKSLGTTTNTQNTVFKSGDVTNGNLALWNTLGELVDGPSPSAFLPKSGGVMTGAIDMGTNPLSSTGTISAGSLQVSGALEVTGNAGVGGSLKIGSDPGACTSANEGGVRYNAITKALEFCNGTSWNLVQASTCSNATPSVFSFANQANLDISTLTTSNIVQINGFDCALPATISGPGSPAYRSCADSDCNVVIQDWTTNPSSVLSGYYIQVRQTSASQGGVTSSATLIIGGTASVWRVSTAGDCSNSPSIGTVCADGSVYAGISPDTNAPMYTQRCDMGQTWDGEQCTGSRFTISWNKGTSGNAVTGFGNPSTGRANTSGLALLQDSGAPYQAALTCESLNENGHSDWYLPARNELNALYAEREVIGNFNLTSGAYWTSTEYSLSYAWYQSFSDGVQGAAKEKQTFYFVRCVRR